MTRLSRWAFRLQNWLQRAIQFVIRHQRAIRWVMIACFVVFWTAIATVKFARFAFDGLDLAIYTQVVWNTAHGNWFAFSIHHQSYLGDHLELGLAALAPFFRLLPHPLTLLGFQALVVGLAAWPLGRLAQRRLGSGWAVFVTFAYLVNPSVQNMLLYEFHFLTFALLPLIFCLDAFDERRYGRYLIAFSLALLVREDVPLVLLMFSLLALLERRHWRWVIPGVLALVWFGGALWLTGQLNPNEQYKFLAFYQWLGPTLPAIVHNALTKPWIIVNRLLTFNNINFVLGMLLPFAFLPALRRRGLWLTLPIFLQLLLIEQLSTLVFKIHYTVLLLPGLFYGFILGLGALVRERRPPAWAAWAQRERAMAGAVLVTVVVYSSLVIGPLVSLARTTTVDAVTRERLRAQRVFVNQLIPRDAGLATSYALTAATATRATLSSLHYVFLGKQQYSEVPFVLPAATDYLLIDRNDAVLYHALYHEHEGDNDGGDERLRALIERGGYGVVEQLGDFFLLTKGRGTPFFVANEHLSFDLNAGQVLGGGLRFISPLNGTLRVRPRLVGGQRFLELPLDLTLASDTPQPHNLMAVVRLERQGKTLANYKRVISPFFPTTNWQAHVPVTWSEALLLPAGIQAGDTVQLEVRDEEAKPWLDGWGTIIPKVGRSKLLGEVTLGVILR